LILNNESNEKVNTFKILGWTISYVGEVDLNHRVERCNEMYGTIKRTLKSKMQRDIKLKFCKIMPVSSGLYGSEASGARNEIFEVVSLGNKK
jgi:hypothetical protein